MSFFFPAQFFKTKQRRRHRNNKDPRQRRNPFCQSFPTIILRLSSVSEHEKSFCDVCCCSTFQTAEEISPFVMSQVLKSAASWHVFCQTRGAGSLKKTKQKNKSLSDGETQRSTEFNEVYRIINSVRLENRMWTVN